VTESRWGAREPPKPPGEQAGAAQPVKLHCLGGQSPSPELASDLLGILSLPEAARRRFWEVLGPSLGDPVPREVEGKVARFVAEHGADAGATPRALKAARTLVRLASALDVGPKQLAEDLTRVAGGSPAIAEVILPGYDRARARLRAELGRRTVADHGRVLEAVRWRVDVLGASDRGLGLKLPVVTLTLHYREAGRREQLSVQVLPEVMKQLRDVCDRVLGRR
jgi:hypothetical protein